MKETTALRDGLLMIFMILLSLTLVSMAVFTCSKKKKDPGCIGGCGGCGGCACGDGGGCGGCGGGGGGGGGC